MLLEGVNIMGNSVKVLMAGSTVNVKGGMTTVVKSFLSHTFSPQFQLKFIPTHSENGRLYNSLFFLKSYFSFLYTLLFHSPDLVHLHMSDKGSFFRKYILFRSAKFFYKPVIVHAHGGDFLSFYHRMPRLVKWSVRDMLKGADRVLALGKNWEKILSEIEPEADIMVLMNSVPLPERGNEVQKSGFSVLFLAVVSETKGIFDLIDAAETVLAHESDVRFDIAGDGDVLEEAKRRVKRAGLDRFFRFHGWVDHAEKAKLLQQADLFVLPSYFEGMPMSILEAASYGKPILATDVGSINDAVSEGENGYLLKPGDTQALAYYLEKMICDPEIEKMGLASRRIAEEKFDEKHFYQKVEDLYAECTRGQRLQLNRKNY